MKTVCPPNVKEICQLVCSIGYDRHGYERTIKLYLRGFKTHISIHRLVAYNISGNAYHK